MPAQGYKIQIERVIDFGGDEVKDVARVIDDRTGTVCSVEYRGLEAEYDSWEMQQILEGFCRTYLEGLGEEFFDYSAEDLTSKLDMAVDQSYMAAQLRFNAWDDPLYGETRIVFFLNRNGFYTYFE